MLTSLSVITYHTLLGMTALSLYRASTIPPGTPNQRYARPRNVEPDREEEADFRGISVTEWRRRRGEKSGDEEGDDDLPLSAIKALERPTMNSAEIELEPGDGGSPYPPASPPPIRSDDRLLRRWCKECQAWKPPRCHHCRTCGICVLKVRPPLSLPFNYPR
jgi:ribosomal protein L40E